MTSAGHELDIILAAPDGQDLTAGVTYDTGPQQTPTSAGVLLSHLGSAYLDATGELHRPRDAQTDAGGAAVAFAADYFDFSCGGAGSTSGVLRWNSAVPYSVANLSKDNLVFGKVGAGTTSAPLSTTLTNEGPGPLVSPGGATVTGPSRQSAEVTVDTCAHATLQPGDSCVVTVVARPLELDRLGANLVVPIGRGGPVLKPPSTSRRSSR